MASRLFSRIAVAVAFVGTIGAAIVALGTPAGAQQLVDAGGGNGSGGLAFVLFAVMVAVCTWALFYMDRVRRRRASSEDQDRS